MTTISDLSCRCDYYRATTLDGNLIGEQLEHNFSEAQTDATGGLYRYGASFTNRYNGAIYLFNGHTPTMGNCIQVSGTPISKLMDETGLSSVPAIKSLHVDGWKPTRVDVAIDCFHPSLRPRDFMDALGGKKVKTCFRGDARETKSQNPDNGHTVYMGGVESEKQLRVYDKHAEQGTKGIWTRYEMVFNGSRALDAWAAIQGVSTDAELLTIALSMLASMVDFPKWKLWRDVFGVETTHQWTAIPRSESATWKWLMKQVAPAFRTAYDSDGGWNMLERFVREVKQTVSE